MHWLIFHPSIKETEALVLQKNELHEFSIFIRKSFHKYLHFCAWKYSLIFTRHKNKKIGNQFFGIYLFASQSAQITKQHLAVVCPYYKVMSYMTFYNIFTNIFAWLFHFAIMGKVFPWLSLFCFINFCIMCFLWHKYSHFTSMQKHAKTAWVCFHVKRGGP